MYLIHIAVEGGIVQDVALEKDGKPVEDFRYELDDKDLLSDPSPLLEFQIGDKVTYKPYEKEIKAVVKGVEVINNQDTIYQLSNRGRTCIVTYTTGKSIMESVMYKPYEGELE